MSRPIKSPKDYLEENARLLQEKIEKGEEGGSFSRPEVAAMMAHFAIAGMSDLSNEEQNLVLMSLGDRIIIRLKQLQLGKVSLESTVKKPTGILQRSVGNFVSRSSPLSPEQLLDDRAVQHIAAKNPKVPPEAILNRLLANDVSWFIAPTKELTSLRTSPISQEQIAQELTLALGAPIALNQMMHDAVIWYIRLGNADEVADKLRISIPEANLILRDFAAMHQIELLGYKKSSTD